MKKQKQSSKKTGKEIKDGDVPGTFANQNLGHNSKKEGMGQNTNR